MNLEVVLKPPLRPNFCVGPKDSILEISCIFLRLNPSLRLDVKPDGRFWNSLYRFRESWD
jgi:hypothetical protein